MDEIVNFGIETGEGNFNQSRLFVFMYLTQITQLRERKTKQAIISLIMARKSRRIEEDTPIYLLTS